ncbi:MAG: NAD(P)/FAD-dependent oxidoreductase [Clostridia bacterium]|nr:NAD(P)/FAD-dependent oxidoreductase [Clostridia bacterium]
MKQFDVVIIGGGPSGTSTGTMLVKSGFSTLIIDKHTFPRKKLCAGGVTPQAKKLYDQIFGEGSYTFSDTTDKFKIYFMEKFILNGDDFYTLNFVRREVFDNQLLTRYKELGGQTIEGKKAIKFDLENNVVTLEDGEQIGYKVLVGADGATSLVRKLFNKDYKPNIFCMETYPKNTLDCHSVSLYAGLGGGYGWIFPHGDSVAVGYCGPTSRSKQNCDEFEDFIKLTGFSSEGCDIRGAYIPTEPVEVPCYKNVLLVGDAGGFVFPFTGEGLCFAPYTAMRASETITAYLGGQIALEDLPVKYKESLQKIYKIGHDFNELIKRFGKKKFLVRVIKSRLIRGIGLRYCRRHPDFVNYVIQEALDGDFSLKSIRKKFKAQKKANKKK